MRLCDEKLCERKKKILSTHSEVFTLCTGIKVYEMCGFERAIIIEKLFLQDRYEILKET